MLNKAGLAGEDFSATDSTILKVNCSTWCLRIHIFKSGCRIQILYYEYLILYMYVCMYVYIYKNHTVLANKLAMQIVVVLEKR